MQQKSRCLFCETADGKRTREHVWRNALRTRFPPAPSLTFWQKVGDDASVVHRPGSQFDMTINAVCQDCNSGWLNQLEDAALPVLRYFGLAEGRVPTCAEFADFSFWAVTRALVRTHASPAGRAPAHMFHSIYARRTTRELPVGCHVRIAPTSPVDMEAGTHQSIAINGGYLGHVAVGFGMLLISIVLSSPDELCTQLARRAANQSVKWFPGRFWQIAPRFWRTVEASPRPFTPYEAWVAGASLGFMLDFGPCDQFGTPLDLAAVVPLADRGIVPWPMRSRWRRADPAS